MRHSFVTSALPASRGPAGEQSIGTQTSAPDEMLLFEKPAFFRRLLIDIAGKGLLFSAGEET